jgi:hypothetical protein
MGLFKKKQSQFIRQLTPEEQERNALGNRIKNDFYPHTNEFDYFLNLGFPRVRSETDTDEYFNWRPRTAQEFTTSEIKEHLYALRDKVISIDEITQRIFGFNSFGEFVEHTQNELKSSAAAASEMTLKMLETEPPSIDWLKFIQFGPVDGYIKKWLEDLGDRKSTHSSVGSMFSVRTSELQPYVQAAVIGFRVVHFVLQQNKVEFNVLTTTEAGRSLVNDCVFFRGTATDPLDVVNSSVFEVIDGLINGLDEQMRTMLGDTPTTENLSMTPAPVPFKVSLMASANGGAMMACVMADPSNCIFYEGWKFNKQIQDPMFRKWHPGSAQ